MRLFVLFFLLIASVTIKAQIPSLGLYGYPQRSMLNRGISVDSPFHKKWFVSTYTGISTSFSFYKGGNATVIAAPMGLQLNRRMNDNLYAFAGVSVAPAYVNFNQTFLNTNIKGLPANNATRYNNFGIATRAEMGLMYVNDAKTFSISGSIGIEQNNYPTYYYNYNQPNNNRQNNTVRPNR